MFFTCGAALADKVLVPQLQGCKVGLILSDLIGNSDSPFEKFPTLELNLHRLTFMCTFFLYLKQNFNFGFCVFNKTKNLIMPQKLNFQSSFVLLVFC